jgi:SsrA-binding protein
MSTSVIKNRKAFHEFEILESFTAGIQLTGTEIKSVRDGKVNMNDAYCYLQKGELWIKNMHISEYEKGTHYNHEPKRDRKLLLTKKELKKLDGKMKEKGFAVVPLKIFFSGTGYAKVEIALARGKKLYDKRDSIKERDVKREMERE